MIRTPHFATFIHKVVLVGFVTLGLVISTSAQSARQPVPIELSLTPYVANLRTLSVTVGGETAPFLLDTGGGFTAVTPEFARAIGCVAFGRVTGFRSSGERIDMLRCGAVSMMLGPAPFRTEAAIFDLMSLLKGAPPIAGVSRSIHCRPGRSPWTWRPTGWSLRLSGAWRSGSKACRSCRYERVARPVVPRWTSFSRSEHHTAQSGWNSTLVMQVRCSSARMR